MSLLGDRRRFAVEYELNDDFGGVWMFGKVCYWICGQQVGDWDLGTSLRDLLFLIEEGRRDHGRRSNPRFDSLSPVEAFDLLHGVLFEEDPEELVEVATDEQWARHALTPFPFVDVFDGWKIYLIETSSEARLLFRHHGDQASRACFLMPGECDQVLDLACRELGAIYEAQVDDHLQAEPDHTRTPVKPRVLEHATGGPPVSTSASSCPVCGYELGFASWSGSSPSDEICPSCGIQFGYDDHAAGRGDERARVYQEWRGRWIKNGCPWSSVGISPPAGWNPYHQMNREKPR